jgi:hypothetical protein
MSGHMNWNKQTQRYEGVIDGKKLCVDVVAFHQAYDKALASTVPADDEQRIWGVLTWFSTWLDKNGKPVGGAYFEGQK